MRRRAKIAATLGPACESPAVLDALFAAGLDVARLNFSHGTAADHRRMVRRVRAAARKAGRPVTVLADLQGPRFRVGELPGGRLSLAEGDDARLRAGTRTASDGEIPVAYAALARDVKKGQRILIDDGRVELVVRGVRGDLVRCRVARGGVVRDRKGINLPGTALSVPALMDKDRRDLATAVELGADWLAVSFVRTADDVRAARKLLKRYGSAMAVMAKIERPEAVENLEEILEASDGILVARGDLGVELPPERVPILQKRMIERATALGKPVVTATQMLDSMRTETRPTRAEASDVANAVLDGSSCLLLTGETAAGEHPVEAVRMMARIIDEAEASGRAYAPDIPRGELSIAVATSLAACRAAFDVGARYLVVFTETGFSARQSARFRPRTPILAYTPDLSTACRLNLGWGVEPRVFRRQRSVDRMLAARDAGLLADRRGEPGGKVVVVVGTPVGVGGTTNLMEVRRVGVSPTKHLVAKKRERAAAEGKRRVSREGRL